MGKNSIIEKNHFFNSRGYKIFYQIWKPTKGKILGTVTIIHGLGEHIGRYDELANLFAELGFSSFGLDLYGFGQSEGKRGDVYDIEDYLKDIKTLFSMEEKYYDIPSDKKLLMGHSMGGLLALAYLERYPDDHELSIVSAPALNPTVRVSGILYLIALVLKLFYPSLQLSNKIRPDEITSDKGEQEHLKNDELVHDKISLRLFFELVKLSKSVWKGIDKINKNLRILFLHGERDEIALKEDTQRFFNLLQVNNKRIEILTGMKHEVHTDVNRKITFNLIKEWLNTVTS